MFAGPMVGSNPPIVDTVSSNSSRTLLDIMQGVKSLPLFAVSSKFEDSLGENKGIVALHCEKTLP